MLREIAPVLQWPGEPMRRVFQDADFDLFVWYADSGIERFQLGYDKRGTPRVLEWVRGRLYHYGVDTGDTGRTGMDMTPLLVAHRGGDPAAVADALEQCGIDGAPLVLHFVLARLRAHPSIR